MNPDILKNDPAAITTNAILALNSHEQYRLYFDEALSPRRKNGNKTLLSEQRRTKVLYPIRGDSPNPANQRVWMSNMIWNFQWKHRRVYRIVQASEEPYVLLSERPIFDSQYQHLNQKGWQIVYVVDNSKDNISHVINELRSIFHCQDYMTSEDFDTAFGDIRSLIQRLDTILTYPYKVSIAHSQICTFVKNYPEYTNYCQPSLDVLYSITSR